MRISARTIAGFRAFLVLSILMPWGASFASADEPAWQNLAKGAAYTLSPTPNYEHCTDSGDATQLTDGVYTEGHFWTQPSTVGWTGAGQATINIDLGAEKPIRGISFNTAAGVAGVTWPRAIFIFVAGEDKQYRWIGDLAALSAKPDSSLQGGYAVHKFTTDKLRIHGRYVGLVVVNEPFTFVDEIEVAGGEEEWLSSPVEGEAIADLSEFVQRINVHTCVQRRLREDVDSVRKASKANGVPADVADAVSKELDAIAAEQAGAAPVYPAAFKAILPLTPLHARVFQCQAKLWSAKGLKPVQIWQTGLWEPLDLFAEPPMEAEPLVDVWMMNNEYRAGSFNITNTTTEDMEVTLRFEGLPGGAVPAYVTVHEVAWTDTRTGFPVAAALPLAEKKDDGYVIHVPSGMTRQVWLTFHPTDLEATVHSGTIALNAGATTQFLPVRLQVYPVRFPEKPRLHFGGWDYTDRPSMYGVTEAMRDEFIADLKEHFVDSPWASPGTLAAGEFDASGAYVKTPDTAYCDAWLDRWAGAGQYCVFAAVSNKLGGFEMGTAPFDAAVKQWITFWANHFRERGLKPEQLAILLVDEPQSPEQDAVIAAWAKPIREAATGVRVWEDPIYDDITVANAAWLPFCDVLCPNRPSFLNAKQDFRDFFVEQHNKGVALDFYSCSGPARLLDPYTYHRLQAWTCWQYGAKSTYFWAFGDTGGGDSWNEYGAKGNGYAMSFVSPEGVTDGKHMEACRESIEDYEYLAMLKDAADDAAARGVDAAKVDAARTLLTDLPARVCAAYEQNRGLWWKDSDADRSVADKARKELLDALVSLRP
ncbi:MAG: hypothetical protein K1Y02_13230 [Candidatus Hydrogenedentes bacterium]|nr:hypothetical protein [Candidatus Hydrogenedentota bacterium]